MIKIENLNMLFSSFHEIDIGFVLSPRREMLKSPSGNRYTRPKLTEVHLALEIRHLLICKSCQARGTLAQNSYNMLLFNWNKTHLMSSVILIN